MNISQWTKLYSGALIVGGFLGWIAAFTLLFERLQFLMGDVSKPSCSLNIFIDCGRVFNSAYASLFGFPNVIIGLTFFPLAIVAGILFLTNAQVKNWVWRLGRVPLYCAIAFCFVLLYITSFLIGAVCLWCMLAWTATFLIAYSYISLTNYQEADEAGKARLLKSWNAGYVLVWFGALSAFFIGILFASWWINEHSLWSKFPHHDPFFWLKK
jgi:uncharacterized membrane protein